MASVMSLSLCDLLLEKGRHRAAEDSERDLRKELNPWTWSLLHCLLPLGPVLLDTCSKPGEFLGRTKLPFWIFSFLPWLPDHDLQKSLAELFINSDFEFSHKDLSHIYHSLPPRATPGVLRPPPKVRNKTQAFTREAGIAF